MIDFAAKLSTHVINSFRGQYDFLGNFHPSVIRYEGVLYPNVETAYQCAKTESQSERDCVMYLYEGGLPMRRTTPGEAKKFGRRVTLRADWEDVKVGIMLDLLREKFKAPQLAELLRATGHAQLEEANEYGDRYWGTCNGEGLNMLGILLMEVRDELRCAR